MRRGEEVHLVGLSGSQQVTSRRSFVTNAAASLTVAAADCPRYRAMNMDVVEIDNGKKGRMQALVRRGACAAGLLV